MSVFRSCKYPDTSDPTKVGKYYGEAYSGGVCFYDDVLEYRVWVKERSQLRYHAFASYEDALRFSRRVGAEEPIVLVKQNSYVEEDEAGHMKHMQKPRIAEWQVEWLKKAAKGTADKIPDFIAKHHRAVGR